MRVIFSIPTLTGEIKSPCHQSLIATYRLLRGLGIDYEEHIIEHCPCLSVARASLAAMFMADAEATDQFLIDADVKFDPQAVVEMLKREESIVAGIYPLKRDIGGFPVKIRTNQDGIPYGRDGLIEAELLPAGFMRIKRVAYELLAEHYPELKYEDSVVRTDDHSLDNAYDFFGMGVYGRRFTTEDFAFCQRWRDIGGTLWVYSDIDFQHIGPKAYSANYRESLISYGRTPDITRATAVQGWMSIPELNWLGLQAKLHKDIVEIGSWMGRSTRAIADNTSGTVHAVDTWEGSPEHADMIASIPQGGVYGAFLSNVADLKNVIPVRLPSTEAEKSFGATTFDMIFIDAAHDYESVKADLQAWLPRLQSSGLLCGHDFDWPGVKQAVMELLPGAKQVPNTSIWFWRKYAE